MERPKKAKPRKVRLSSVANAIRLTKAFSEHDYEMGISALATRLGLAKSTVHRLAATLVQHDILEQNSENGRYRLGLALFELGALVRRQMDVANEARPQLRALMEMTGETVQLAILDHQSVLYINKMESSKAVRMSSNVGSRAPIHCTGVGKVLLAYQSPDAVQRVIDSGLPRHTDSTIVTPGALRKELAAIRAKGFSFDDEENEVGLRCVAAPIRNHNADVIAAISVAGPLQRMNKKTVQAIAPAVIAAAETISRRLGNTPNQAIARLTAR